MEISYQEMNIFQHRKLIGEIEFCIWIFFFILSDLHTGAI